MIAPPPRAFVWSCLRPRFRRMVSALGAKGVAAKTGLHFTGVYALDRGAREPQGRTLEALHAAVEAWERGLSVR